MLAKVEQKRKRNNVLDKTFYCCTKYRKFGKEGCSSHTIEARTVHEVVLADIQKHAGQALADRKAMVTEIAERLNLQLSADKEQQKKELRQCKQRVSEIENLYAKLYEDYSSGKLSELERQHKAKSAVVTNAEQFTESLAQCAGMKKLTATVLNALIEKIEVHNPVMVNGVKEQKLTVYYKFVGQID